MCVRGWGTCKTVCKHACGMYVCMYVCMCVYVCILYVCMYVCLYVCMYVCMYTYVCLCVYMYVCMYVFIYACMYVLVYVCILYVSMYTCMHEGRSCRAPPPPRYVPLPPVFSTLLMCRSWQDSSYTLSPTQMSAYLSVWTPSMLSPHWCSTCVYVYRNDPSRQPPVGTNLSCPPGLSSPCRHQLLDPIRPLGRLWTVTPYHRRRKGGGRGAMAPNHFIGGGGLAPQ